MLHWYVPSNGVLARQLGEGRLGGGDILALTVTTQLVAAGLVMSSPGTEPARAAMVAETMVCTMATISPSAVAKGGICL